MIGQHIYSRCLEGYFSKSGLNADSTTVTISIDMFARKEQARRIARKCEEISTLEDIRVVPSKVENQYRGVLKICRLNRQLTVVCRSYRLHSEQGQTGRGESRDFTYGSSYILSGNDRERFLTYPEYCLNVQDFEPYSSVVSRIEEARKNGGNGRIEDNKSYSLFRSGYPEVGLDIFAQAGFTKQLFIEYISSIIQRVSYSHYSGHENDKVLVVLPRQMNIPWELGGGNEYAEKVLTATLKILPLCVRAQLSATTGGMDDPDAFVLNGYQLVFMEKGATREWRRSEYSIIDLDRQESFITEGLDTSYGEFIWKHLSEKSITENFEREYRQLFGNDQTSEGDNSLEKFSLAMRLFQEEKEGFLNRKSRGRALSELIDCSGDFWTIRAAGLLKKALRREINDPGYSAELEEALVDLDERETCPGEIKDLIASVVVEKIFHGNASNRSVLWVCKGIQEQNQIFVKQVSEMNKRVITDTDILWHTHDSLLTFYLNICKSQDINADTIVKRQVFEILSNWYIGFLEKNDWKKCAQIVGILSEQLEDPRLREDQRREIYQDLIYLLFYGDERKDISNILKAEEKRFSSSPENIVLFWECFKTQMQRDDICINEDVIWQITYLALCQDKDFLQNEWKELYHHMVCKFGQVYGQEIFQTTRKYFLGWKESIQDPQKLQLVYQAVAVSEMENIEYGSPAYIPDIDELRETLKLLKENRMFRPEALLLYKRYQAEKGGSQQKYEFLHKLNEEEIWKVILIWRIGGVKDSVIKEILPELYEIRKEFLRVAADFEWHDKTEITDAAKIYFYLLSWQVQERKDREDLLRIWCGLYKEELKDISGIVRSEEFTDYIRKCFRSRIAKCNPLSCGNLDIGDIVFLKETGMLPLGSRWVCLDILSEIFTADSNTATEEFVFLREKIIAENRRELKQIYADGLKAKRNLLKPGERNELVFNITLLEEQIRRELGQNGEVSLENITFKIYGEAEERTKLLTAFWLLYVMGCYGVSYGNNVYDCSDIGNSIIRKIIFAAKRNPELFADKEVLVVYKRLNHEIKAALLQEGLGQYLRKLSGEWKKRYGAYNENGRSVILLPIVFSVIFFLIGLGAELLFFFFYERIGGQRAVIIGTLTVMISAVGIWIVLVCKLIAVRSQKYL